jgi:hypothetical protein
MKTIQVAYYKEGSQWVAEEIAEITSVMLGQVDVQVA